jgi:hypothetical protein
MFLAALALAFGLTMSRQANAQTTNWIAFNDHRGGALVPPHVPTSATWGTAPNVTVYDMGAPADLAASALTDFLTGNPLTATVSFARTGGPDDFGTVGPGIRTNTPMARIFFRVCDLQINGLVGVRAVPPNTAESYVTMTFGGLDPSKRYVFRGTVARNGGYGTRWSLASIAADGWTDAHINGDGGPGVLTGNSFPASALSVGQAAFNSGANNEGAVVGWNDIAPFPDGTFSITNQQYTGAIPGGRADGPYGYSFAAMMLAEVEVVAPTITAHPAASTTVEQNRPFSLSVAATGAPLNYQWYKESTGEIPGATFPAFSVAQAQVADSDRYYAVVFNSLARRTSTVAQVTVFADTTAPTVETIFSYPNVDASGVATLDQIIIEYNEPVSAASVGSPASYTVPGGGNPASVIVTNERSVVLMLSTPLMEDRDYSVTLGGATDAVGNVAGSGAAPFHSWVSGIGNGLLMESYAVEDPAITPESVVADPDYPNNPDRRDTLSAFDTRLVYPTDDAREGYGARVRGVFIPPISGGWRFFARTRQLGVVYLNPNGTAEDGKVEILRQSTENAPYNWDRLQSSLFTLRAGQAYYIEGLYKGAVGPDYLKVAARPAGTGVPTPVDSPDTDAPDANSLAGAIIAYPLAPRQLGGALTIVQNAGDVTSQENKDATFSIVVNNPSGLPLFYKWYKDGAEIPGATGPSYTTTAFQADDGALFRVDVAKVGASLTSRDAKLTVTADTAGPRVVEVSSVNLSNIVVRFDEPVEQFSATEPFGYALTGPSGPIAMEFNPALGADGKSVILDPAEDLVAGVSYELSIADVTDASLKVMAPNPTVVTFVAGGAQPLLTIARSGNQAVLSWEASAVGYRLEQTSALANPVSATVWTDVGATPAVVDGRNNVTVAAGPGNKSFRLRR